MFNGMRPRPNSHILDRANIIKHKDAYGREQLVRAKEAEYLRNKLKWCYRREGVNHFQNCRHLSIAYLDLLKEMQGGPYFRGFKLPKTEN
jgi:NADH dehydrogenase (ubiquinone) 1 beta subcomplex subunit 10